VAGDLVIGMGSRRVGRRGKVLVGHVDEVLGTGAGVHG
jgi:hypothetical protein